MKCFRRALLDEHRHLQGRRIWSEAVEVSRRQLIIYSTQQIP